MMKRTVAFILFFAVMFCLCACVPETAPESGTEIRVAAMAGPTGIGLVSLLDTFDPDRGSLSYEIMPSQNGAQLIMASLLDGSLDFACLPCNVAATAFNKGADIRVVAINTFGVLYFVENGNTVASLRDLHGKIVYTVNKGSTTEYALKTVLELAGITDCEVVFEEQTAVQTRLAGEESVIALLPQPLAATVLMTNPKAQTALSLGDEYRRLTEGEEIVTGVLVVRGAYADSHPEIVRQFLTEYERSINYARSHVEETASLCETYGVIPKAAVAKKAIPSCSLIYSDGEKMKQYIEKYLTRLYVQNPASVGGKLPSDAFYYDMDDNG